MALVALFAGMMMGCEKEKTFVKQNSTIYDGLSKELQELYEGMSERVYGEISLVGDGILRFDSEEQLELTCAMLKEDCEEWNDLFYEQYGYLTKLDFMDLEDSLGFDEFLPIELFEEAVGTLGTTLYDSQKLEMQNWMSNDCKGENPIDKIFIFEWEQALYNQYREICIGDTLFQYRNDAIIKIPVENVNEWIRIRSVETKNLLDTGFVIVEDLKVEDTEENISEKVHFKCYDEGILDASTDPNLYEGKDYSYWIVVGRTGINLDNRMESKLVNYSFHKYDKSGKPVYKKNKRLCSIATTYQVFFKKHYRGWINPTYVGIDRDTLLTTLPPQVLQKTAAFTANAFIWPSQPTHLTSHYKRGVYQNPIMKWKIDETERTVVLNMKHIR